MLERELAEIQAEKEAAALAEDYERAAKLRQRELQVTGEAGGGARARPARSPTMMVTPADIAKVVEVWTGVPVTPDARG